MLARTRSQLIAENRLHSPPYSYYDKWMNDLFRGKDVKIIHSDVYYVRAALENRTGLIYSLPVVEKMMREAGWDR